MTANNISEKKQDRCNPQEITDSNNLSDNRFDSLPSEPLQTREEYDCSGTRNVPRVLPELVWHIMKKKTEPFRLNLACCTLKDKDLTKLLPLGDRICSLDLSYCVKLTDACFDILAELPHLEALHLGGCKKISDAGINRFREQHPQCCVDRECPPAQPVSWKSRIYEILVCLSIIAMLAVMLLPGIDRTGHPRTSHFLPETAVDKDLENLSMTMTSLDIRRCIYLTDQGLAALKKYPSLHYLDMTGCPQFTDSGLAHLAEVRSLRTISMSGCAGITDQGLAALTSLPELTDVDFPEQTITDNGLKYMGQMPKLETLTLSGEEYSDIGLEAFTNTARSLVRLTIQDSNNKITDRGFKGIGKLKILEEIRLNDCMSLTDEGIKALAGCQNLKSVDMHGMKITGSGFGLLTELPNLHALFFEAVELTNDGLAAIGKLQQVQDLRIRDAIQLDSSGIKHLSDMTELNMLELRQISLDDEGFAALGTLPKLEALSIRQTNVTGTGFRSWAASPVEKIDCSRTKMNDDGLRELARLKHVRSVDLSFNPDNPDITDTGLAELAKMKSLEYFVFSHCPNITDQGLASLGTLPELTNIIMNDCPGITSRGVNQLRKKMRWRRRANICISHDKTYQP